MIERIRLTRRVRARARPNRMQFTELGIRRLKAPTEGQELYWDTGQRGLSLLVSPGGTKTFRSSFKLNGFWVTRTLGRFGEVVREEEGEENANIGWARERTRKDRTLANQGTDPREPKQQPASTLTFASVVDQFIEHYAKPRQCQSAPNFDPVSASNFDPLKRRVLTAALAPSELAGVAETA